MIETKEPKFFKYFDYSTGKMKKDAPESAKKEFKAWKNNNPMKVKVSTKSNKKTVKRK